MMVRLAVELSPRRESERERRGVSEGQFKEKKKKDSDNKHHNKR
jgi:hypothetical protein